MGKQNMTEQDAIKMLEYRIETATQIAGKGEDGKAFEDMEMAIEALKLQEKLKTCICGKSVDIGMAAKILGKHFCKL